MQPVKVFISSALEELEHEREIAKAAIQRLRLVPVLFEGLPPTSKALEESYLDEVRDCDLFVLILWKSLRRPVRKELHEASLMRKPILVLLKDLRGSESRDRDLLEFIGGLGGSEEELDKTQPERTGEHSQRFVPFYKSFRSLSDLESLLGDGLSFELSRLLRRTITTTHSRLEMYELGSRIAEFAKRRLYVVQRTPLLLLGAREYGDSSKNKVWYEQSLLDELNKWAERTTQDDSAEFVCLFDLHATRQEIRKSKLQKTAKRSLARLKRLEQKSGRRFRFLPMPASHSGPVTIGDDWAAIWILGEEDAACVSVTNRDIADKLVEVLSPLGTRHLPVGEMMSELGLK